MITQLKKWFGIQTPDWDALLKQQPVILDVRTKAECKGGCIKGSINIPLDQLHKNLHKLNKQKTVITCCASGMRSAAAKRLLKENGFADVYNGGNWFKLQQKI